MSLLNFKKWLISVFNPPYQLTLSEIIKHREPNKTIYIFKLYASHEYVKLTFPDIIGNNALMRSINPHNLMEIRLNEHNIQSEYNTYQIIETQRGNHYTLANRQEARTYSGEYICKNIDMFSSLQSNDLCRIAYMSGFNKGRKVSAEAKLAIRSTEQRIANDKENNNIIEFRKNKL